MNKQLLRPSHLLVLGHPDWFVGWQQQCVDIEIVDLLNERFFRIGRDQFACFDRHSIEV